MNIDTIFVYGTLKQGQLRSGLWPRKPIRVRQATVRGTLFDLGPYPAASEGSDLILGEAWEFNVGDMQETLVVLDRIEGFTPGGTNHEYIRVEAETTIDQSHEEMTQIVAWMYRCADPKRLQFARKIPATKSYRGIFVSEWPDSLSRVPRSFGEE